MIYGLNFNGIRIPDGITPRFRERLKRNSVTGQLYPVPASRGCDFVLQGVCNTETELNSMLGQADNGRRAFHIVRQNGWIAVYVGYKESV